MAGKDYFIEIWIRQLLKIKKLKKESWNMDHSFMRNIKIMLKDKVDKDILFRKLNEAVTLKEKTARAFVLSFECCFGF